MSPCSAPGHRLGGGDSGFRDCRVLGALGELTACEGPAAAQARGGRLLPQLISGGCSVRESSCWQLHEPALVAP